jgi:PIN domain nuclease of toxin-antitoxin system
MDLSGFRPLPVSFEHAFGVRDLPLHHADPFDRMLIAQAICEKLTIVTADADIRAYDIPTLDASI